MRRKIPGRQLASRFKASRVLPTMLALLADQTCQEKPREFSAGGYGIGVGERIRPAWPAYRGRTILILLARRIQRLANRHQIVAGLVSARINPDAIGQASQGVRRYQHDFCGLRFSADDRRAVGISIRIAHWTLFVMRGNHSCQFTANVAYCDRARLFHHKNSARIAGSGVQRAFQPSDCRADPEHIRAALDRSRQPN